MLISDGALCSAIGEMRKGLVDADLGAGLVKKRISRQGLGKRSGYRTLVATNKRDKWFFIYGFAKSDSENISSKEEEALKKLAMHLLKLSFAAIDHSIQEREIKEVKCYEK